MQRLCPAALMCIIKVSLGWRGGVSLPETLHGRPGPGLHGLLRPRCHPGRLIREGQPRPGHSVTQTQTPQGRAARHSVDVHGPSRRRPRLPGDVAPPAGGTQGLWLQPGRGQGGGCGGRARRRVLGSCPAPPRARSSPELPSEPAGSSPAMDWEVGKPWTAEGLEVPAWG